MRIKIVEFAFNVYSKGNKFPVYFQTKKTFAHCCTTKNGYKLMYECCIRLLYIVVPLIKTRNNLLNDTIIYMYVVKVISKLLRSVINVKSMPTIYWIQRNVHFLFILQMY